MPIDLVADWHEFRGPLVGFGVALVLAMLGRFLRIGLVAAAAGGAGILAGWFAITGQLWVVTPRLSIDDLMLVAVVTLAIGLVSARVGTGRVAALGVLLAALFVGWLLSGRPRHVAQLRELWPQAIAVTAVALLVGHTLTNRPLEPLRLALVGLTLAASLDVVAVPPIWINLSLVPGLVALALLALPPMPGPVALPVAIDTAAVGSLIVIALGRLPHLAVGRIDIAALSPLLALWLLPFVAARLRITGRAAPLASCLLAGGIAVCATWATHVLFIR